MFLSSCCNMSIKCILPPVIFCAKKHQKKFDDRPFPEDDYKVFPRENLYDRIILPGKNHFGHFVQDNNQDEEKKLQIDKPLPQPQSKPKHPIRKLPDVINTSHSIPNAGEDFISKPIKNKPPLPPEKIKSVRPTNTTNKVIGRPNASENVVKKANDEGGNINASVKLKEIEKPSAKFLPLDIKGERNPVITPTTTVPAPQYAINKKQSGGVNHETQGTQSQILRQSSTLNLSLSEVNPAERRTVIVNDVVSNGDRNHNQPCNMNVILNTIALNGLDKDCPPPLPPRRGYTLTGDKKVSFPHLRTLALVYHHPPHLPLDAGQQVLVTGISHRPSRFLVQKNGFIFHIPFNYFI